MNTIQLIAEYLAETIPKEFEIIHHPGHLKITDNVSCTYTIYLNATHINTLNIHDWGTPKHNTLTNIDLNHPESLTQLTNAIVSRNAL